MSRSNERHNEWHVEWRKKNLSRARAIGRKAYWKRRDVALSYYEENREHILKQAKDYRDRLRVEVFSHYGGEVCACCGITEPSFLTLGHVNGDGAAHRRELNLGKGGGYNFYRWLKRNNYPPLPLRVECFNCNCSKHYRSGGKCIHES
jgi:hypothetical protein